MINSTADTAKKQVLVVRPRSGWVPVDLAELWHHRELALTLAQREVLVRYKQSALGAGWAIVQPLLTMVVFAGLFSALFGRQNLPTAGTLPYTVSTYCALLPWQLFAQAVSRASVSVVNNQSLISKVYFPRLIIPLAPVLAALMDFVIAFALLVIMMVWYGIAPSPAVALLPCFVVLALATALAFSLLLASINVIYRDVQHVVPFLVQILMYLSPVFYSTQAVLKNQPDWVRFVYFVNPMTGVIEGFRWVLLGAQPPDPRGFLVSVVAVVAALIFSLYFFKRTERRFADIV